MTGSQKLSVRPQISTDKRAYRHQLPIACASGDFAKPASEAGQAHMPVPLMKISACSDSFWPVAGRLIGLPLVAVATAV